MSAEVEGVMAEMLGEETYVGEVLGKDSISLWAPTDQMGASSSTFSNDSIVACRICKVHGGQDLVISPCHCKGTMGTVHVSCLEKWLSGSVRDSCELCHAPLKVMRTRRYSPLQAAWTYLRHHAPLMRLTRDCFFLGVSLLNTIILTYMWLSYILRDVFRLTGDVDRAVQFASPLRAVIYLLFFTLCLVFVVVNTADDFRRVVHYYFMPGYHWWQTNVDVTLIIDDDHKNIGDKLTKQKAD